jgi:hypothetical protein
LTHETLNGDDFHARAVEILRAWIRMDRQTVARFHVKIPSPVGYHAWSTNILPSVCQAYLAWSTTPGENIADIARNAFVPSLLALGVHLQWQDNMDAYRLISALEWVQQMGYGDALTDGLLRGLLETKNARLGPLPTRLHPPTHEPEDSGRAPA